MEEVLLYLYGTRIRTIPIYEAVNQVLSSKPYVPYRTGNRISLICVSRTKSFKEEDRLILSLMVLNYILVKNQIPCVQIYKKDFKEYEQARESYFKGDKTPMLEFTLKLLKDNPYMEKSYYKNLIPVSLSDIIHFVEEKKQDLKTKYQIKGLWIHGSIAKRIERIDSDMDFFIEMSLDLLQEEKLAYINDLKQVFFDEFKRMVDIHELVEYLDDDIIKEARTTKRLI